MLSIQDLHQAVVNNDAMVVSAFIAEHKDNSKALNAADDQGRTALSLAAHEGHIEIVHLLLTAGADVKKTKKNGATPLHIASQNGHHNVVNALVAAGANVNHALLNRGVTPLYLASQNGHHNVVNALVVAGADVNSIWRAPYGDEIRPLQIAITKGHPKVVLQLLIQPSIKMPEELSPSKKLKLAVFDEIMSISDIDARAAILRDANGVGKKGKEHALYKFMNKARFLFTSKNRGTLNNIHQASVAIEEYKKSRQLDTQSSSAVMLQTLTLSPWHLQLTRISSVLKVLEWESDRVAKLLDLRDENNLTFRGFLLETAKHHPVVLEKMREKGLMPVEVIAVPPPTYGESMMRRLRDLPHPLEGLPSEDVSLQRQVSAVLAH